ncbi:hypothetical protein PIROE2DRAFT_13405 [Piromyces sp. E2]|nr:hypothetical protein PIROE2DRAFT_13405 [Piromyces sp. E2]|eukprot:OUM60767.1 hypothetical protein PIROE2DRAFT_13405 [Piromyces sp. E2]
MKFTKILSIAFTLAFAYAQSYPDVSISSDLETAPDTDSAGISPQNTNDSSNYAGEGSDDYGDEAGVNALDGADVGSDNENTENQPSSLPSLSPLTTNPENEASVSNDTEINTAPQSNSPESVVPDATSPEVDNVQNEFPDTIGQKDEIPLEEIPLIKPIFTGASGEAAPIAAAKEANKTETPSKEVKQTPIAALDDNTKTETSIDPAKIASGLVGVAALSSAGIFFMVKRAKRRGLESVLYT